MGQSERAEPAAGRNGLGPRLALASAIVVTLLLWGAAFPLLRAAVKVYSPGHMALLRFLSASAAYASYALIARPPVPRREDWPALVAVGLLGVTGYHVALSYGLVSVPAGVASLLVNTAPVFTALLATLWLGERLGARGWLGTAVSFAGVALVASSRWAGVSPSLAFLLPLASAGCWSVSVVLQKPLLAKMSVQAMTSWTVWIGTIGLLAFAPGLVRAVREAPLPVTWSVVYLGVGPIAVAFATWAYVLQRMEAARASAMLYLIPVLATVIAWIWLGEEPAPASVAGGCLILLGVYVVSARRH